MPTKEYKQLDLAEYELEEDDESWTIKGWAATYDWDRGADKIEPGAMLDSIERRHNRRLQAGKISEVKFLYQHDEKLIIGTPLVMIEDLEKGLWVEAKFIKDDDFPEARRAYKLAKMGYLISFSIGYLTLDSEPRVKVKGQKRLLKKIDIMEFSLVAIPMNEFADVEEVKALDDQITQEHLEEENEMSEAEMSALLSAISEVVKTSVAEALAVEDQAEEAADGVEDCAACVDGQGQHKSEEVETPAVPEAELTPIEVVEVVEVKAEEVAPAAEGPVVVGGINLTELVSTVNSLVESLTRKSTEVEAPEVTEEPVEVKSQGEENDLEVKRGYLDSLKELQSIFAKEKV